MTLKALARLCLAGALAGMVLLAALATVAWQNVAADRAEIRLLAELRQRSYHIRTGIDYSTLQRREPRVLAGIAGDARELARMLVGINHPAASTAGLHLQEIVHLSDRLSRETSGQPGGDSAPADLVLARELRIHEAGLSDALGTILDDRHAALVQHLLAYLLALFLAALGFAALCLFAFLWVYRRLMNPLRLFDAGVRALAQGDLDTRIVLHGDDELGQLAASFNRMVSERGEAEWALAERVKELHCLYQVLAITTRDEGSRDQRLEQVVAILPSGLQYPDIAVARLRVKETSFASENWCEPLVSLRQPLDLEHGEAGSIEIGYRSMPPQDEAFLDEEMALLEAVARHVSRMLNGQHLRKLLAQSERLNAVGELTGGVAHDFNNLLTVILGNAELLELQLADRESQRELASMIGSAAQRGAELTQRLLAFARRQALEPREVDVNALLAGMDALLRRTLGEHIEVELVRAGGLWPTLVDPGQLESALLNLAINARDAMPQGGCLTMETANTWLSEDYALEHVEVDPGQYVLIAVSDTGAGIPRDVLQRVFEPFFTTKDVGKGTGLGLSMVYGFVKQSGGHVKIYSELGQGTTVKMYLPRLLEGGVEPLTPAPQIEAEGGSESILLVEDDELVRRYAADQLVALGYRVLSAGNGPEALAVLRGDSTIDLLFTDVVMPGGMNGRELADAAQKLRPGLRVLYTTGYTENAVVHHGRLDAGVHLLSKPYRRAELARKVRAVLAGPG